MARHPPEIYSPGELDKVRKNLGNLSNEEAKRMAALLGGEVGVEKAAETTHRKHQPIQGKVPASSGRPTAAASARTPPEQTASLQPDPASRTAPLPRLTYRDRIRKNFFASRKDNRVQSFSQSLISLFSFIIPVPDHVLPAFILQSRKLFMEPLEDFVESVRKIALPKNEEVRKKIDPNPFHQRILHTICSWDIGTLHRELSRIRLKPERVRFSDFEDIVLQLYRPYLILHRLSIDRHIRRAVESVGNAHASLLPDELKPAVRKATETACALIPEIFETIRKRCFPLMLQVMPVECYRYARLFENVPEDVQYFFQLSGKDILNPEDEPTIRITAAPARKPAEVSVTDPEKTVETGNRSEQDQPVLPKNTADPLPGRMSAEARKGMENLDKLFPGSGLASMEKRPDLYPLFQQEFQSEPGLDLVPREDSLLQVVFLHRTLNELFYGFRSIEFGSYNTPGLNGMIEDSLEPIFDIWPYFTDEILGKQYFPRLLELQRESERNPEFLRSDYAMKLHADLKWLRRLYLLPFQEIESAAGMRRAAKAADAPVLSEKLYSLRVIFGDVMEDLEKTWANLKERGLVNASDFTCSTVRNPGEKFVFEIENPVSVRLSKLLLKKVKTPEGIVKVKDQRNNANLIMITSSIVLLFETLVNTQDSYFYRDQPAWLFKRQSSDTPAPKAPDASDLSPPTL